MIVVCVCAVIFMLIFLKLTNCLFLEKRFFYMCISNARVQVFCVLLHSALLTHWSPYSIIGTEWAMVYNIDCNFNSDCHPVIGC